MAKIDRAVLQMVKMDQAIHKGTIIMSGEHRDYNRRYKEIVERDFYGARKHDDKTGSDGHKDIPEDICEDV